MIRLRSDLHQLRAAWRVTENLKPSDAQCFDLVNADTPRLYLYGVIGQNDDDAEGFVQTVHGITAKALDLHVNSPGGFVYDAVSMYEALKASPAAVNVHIDGLAASAASFLAMAGDSVDIAKAGRMMIHDAQGIGIGGPADMREYADMLDEVSNDISGFYADRAGGKPAAWRTAMSATTWYSAEQAVTHGLADRIANQTAGPDNRTRLIRARAAITLRG